jgi:acetyltransferase-like isoleucine patch superfamily enzyme
MNSIQRTWLSWKHGRKFAKRGKGCEFPIPDLTIEGHVEIGDLCRFRNNVTLRTYGEGRIIFGSRGGFSWNCLVEAENLVKIGSRCGIAENTVISDRIWEFFGNGLSLGEVPTRGLPVIIEDECFIGSSCFIGPGVHIGKGGVLAHHSVLTRDIAPFEIWSGAPARRVAHRLNNVPDKIREEVERLIAEQGIQEDRNLGEY